MPWCEQCGRYWNPPSMGQGGECPSCDRVIAATPAAAVGGDTGPLGGADPIGAPWHFKLLVGGLVVYLGFRAYQGIAWLVQHLS